MEKQPYLLIVSGPTASGKSSLKDKTIKYLRTKGLQFRRGSPKKVVIDDIIEKKKWILQELGKR